ncbi:MAG: methylated-DNA--[protein]-cysteine S-methyltransferase [Victivallales bacterium]|nr:methylated-DNA--[protein]-cysteine S-methyltransferase [Victivallales bacterium]
MGTAYLQYDDIILEIREDRHGLSSINFVKSRLHGRIPPVLAAAHRQLTEYFAGKRKKFDLKLNPAGTVFQRRVWSELMKIPYGETRSYQDIARNIGNSAAARAVGGANNRNPLPIVIPCHRVIGKNGSLVGFGSGLKIKQYLLKLESSGIKGTVKNSMRKNEKKADVTPP